jgi:uncharacterized protein YcbX
MNKSLRVSGIWVYPVKALGGIPLHSSEVEARGLQYDRRWMLTDSEGNFLSQRDFPRLTLFRMQFQEDGVLVQDPDQRQTPLLIPFHEKGGQNRTVKIWDDRVAALQVSEKADAWFTFLLDRPVRLVRMPKSTRRQVDVKYARSGEVVSFADGYPSLIIGEAALNELNGRLDNPMEMIRFRPNLVFSGGLPHDEDRWAEIRIGGISFSCVKPCARCAVPSIDPATGKKGQEPNRTLATYRQWENKIWFGQNLLHHGHGRIHVGDAVEVLSWKA